ncbi:hypothetical protein AGR5A_Cc170264 [Agrobacterium genomosp. 5 str. CFBP 6626]|nr:hypothetical protein AGR5A_Cc170264 [Agrobacterium genomosp. 5 str. CFBP 6626]
MPPVCFSSIVQLTPHEFQPTRGDAIRLAAGRGDRSLPFQFAEGEEIEAAENPAVTRIEREFFDFVGVVSYEFNSAALGEQVKNALFGAGNVHFLEVRSASYRRVKANPGAVKASGSVSAWPGAQETCGQGLYRDSD